MLNFIESFGGLFYTHKTLKIRYLDVVTKMKGHLLSISAVEELILHRLSKLIVSAYFKKQKGRKLQQMTSVYVRLVLSLQS